MLTAFPAPSTTWKETVSDPATGEPAQRPSQRMHVRRPRRSTDQQDPEQQSTSATGSRSLDQRSTDNGPTVIRPALNRTTGQTNRATVHQTNRRPDSETDAIVHRTSKHINTGLGRIDQLRPGSAILRVKHALDRDVCEGGIADVVSRVGEGQPAHSDGSEMRCRCR